MLYLLHGNRGEARDFTDEAHVRETADDLIRRGEIPPALIVMPDAGSSWYVDRRERMETAFLEDLLPEVERSLPALGSRRGRVIAGVSMGGYGALRFVLERPDLFAAAALLSPAIYVPVPPNFSPARRDGPFGAHGFDPADWRALNYPSLFDGYLRAGTPVPLYLFSGRDDELDIAGETRTLDALLTKSGQPHELHFLPGGHSWSVWRAALPDALRYVFRFASPPVAR